MEHKRLLKKFNHEIKNFWIIKHSIKFSTSLLYMYESFKLEQKKYYFKIIF